MGSDTVEFRGEQFEASNAVLEVWLYLVVEEINRRGADNDWLLELRDDWGLQAKEGFGFGVVPQLDKHVTNSQQLTTLLFLCHSAMQRLEMYGETIGEDELNSWKTGGERGWFTEDVPTSHFQEVGAKFIQILERHRGEFSDTATKD